MGQFSVQGITVDEFLHGQGQAANNVEIEPRGAAEAVWVAKQIDPDLSPQRVKLAGQHQTVTPIVSESAEDQHTPSGNRGHVLKYRTGRLTSIFHQQFFSNAVLLYSGAVHGSHLVDGTDVHR